MSIVRFFSLSMPILAALTLFFTPPAFSKCPENILKRAENGDYNAQCYIGHLYLSGKGVGQDFAKAKYWYNKVINQEGADAKIVAHANFVMGMLYITGKGGELSYKSAIQYFQLAAKQGYTDAHINIGLLYAKGLGVDRDYQKALYWWQLAAKKGHPTAPGYVLELKKKIRLQG